MIDSGIGSFAACTIQLVLPAGNRHGRLQWAVSRLGSGLLSSSVGRLMYVIQSWTPSPCSECRTLAESMCGSPRLRARGPMAHRSAKARSNPLRILALRWVCCLLSKTLKSWSWAVEREDVGKGNANATPEGTLIMKENSQHTKLPATLYLLYILLLGDADEGYQIRKGARFGSPIKASSSAILCGWQHFVPCSLAT